MRDQGGRADIDGVWWSPWPAGAGARALDAGLQARQQGLVVPAGPGAAGLRCFTLDPSAPEGLAIAAAAVHDRFGPPLGALFLAEPALVAAAGEAGDGQLAAALQRAAALPALAEALAPGRPWFVILPSGRGRRAGSAALLALRGAVEGLASARRAAGGRADVLEGPPALWSGQGGAALAPLLAQLEGAPGGLARRWADRLVRRLRG